MNASVGDGELVVHNDVNLGIAVDLDFEGLLAPVVHDADGKRLRAIAREIHDLADPGPHQEARRPTTSPAARSPSPTPARSARYLTLPIINQPQVAILSTDGVHRRPVVVDRRRRRRVDRHPLGRACSPDAGTTGPSTAPTPPRSSREVKEILETRDWEAELA